MDTSPADIIGPELVKRCNPGLTDFGSGSILALSSQCLRSAKQPTACTICIDACPVGALRATALQRPTITRDCLKCGYCIGICPVNAVAATTRTLQQMVRALLQATLRADRIAVTCQRSLALLRLEAESSQPQAAQSALDLVRSAEVTDNLYVLPCLAMLTRELWFTLLNEVGVSRLRKAVVFLPPGQCQQCPVNTKGGVEEAFTAAISTAEQWSEATVGIVGTADELPQYRRSSVRDYLGSSEVTDRRGAFTGLADGLRQTWDDTMRTGNRAADEAVLVRARRETVNNTVLATDQPVATGPDKPILSQQRQALVEAIGRNPANADRVSLLISQTDSERCDACGQCVSTCPVRARRQEDGEVYTDPLYCLGCSACIQRCPQDALGFVRVLGRTFLKDV